MTQGDISSHFLWRPKPLFFFTYFHHPWSSQPEQWFKWNHDVIRTLMNCFLCPNPKHSRSVALRVKWKIQLEQKKLQHRETFKTFEPIRGLAETHLADSYSGDWIAVVQIRENVSDINHRQSAFICQGDFMPSGRSKCNMKMRFIWLLM